MIKNLLLTAATSIHENQRNFSQRTLQIRLQSNQQQFFNDIFILFCSLDKTNHIIAYSYLKKIFKQKQKERFINLNQKIQKAYLFWFQLDKSRQTLQQFCKFQKENIIYINGLFLGLNSSTRYRESFIDIIPFKIVQFASKNNKSDLFIYLTYYTEVLKQIYKYRIGKINSKKLVSGNLMLSQIINKLIPQNNNQASLWLDFTINFSKLCSFSPNRRLMLDCLTKYNISKASLISLMDHLSISFNIIWTLEQQCRILEGITQKMYICRNQISNYTSKDIQTILKCLRSFLHNFFIMDKNINNNGEAMIIQHIYSYNTFQLIAKFIIDMIQYFTINNTQQKLGQNIAGLVQSSTQILRLYSCYLEQHDTQLYFKQFLNKFIGSEKQYSKIFILFSSLPKTILELFNYQQCISMILKPDSFILQRQIFQKIGINFLIHYISINEYMQFSTIENLCQFFISHIKIIQQTLYLMQNTSNSDIQLKRYQQIQRICLYLYGLSKISKYKYFIDINQDYFLYINDRIFDYLLKSTNQFNIIIQTINELINSKNNQWNSKICLKSMLNLLKIYQNSYKKQNFYFYQIQIELYRIMNKTICIEETFKQIQNMINLQGMGSLNYKNNTDDWIQLKLMIYLCNFQAKSQPVKEQIIYFMEQLLIQYNKINYKNLFNDIKYLKQAFFNQIITKSLFQQIHRIIGEPIQPNEEMFIQNNLYEKLQLNNEQFAIICNLQQKQLHLSCIKILLQLSLYDIYIQPIVIIIKQSKSIYLSCLWQAICILYPGKLDQQNIPLKIKQRLQKIINGNLIQLMQQIDINESNQNNKYSNLIQKINKQKYTPDWYKLYRNYLREESIVNQIIMHQINNNKI